MKSLRPPVFRQLSLNQCLAPFPEHSVSVWEKVGSIEQVSAHQRGEGAAGAGQALPVLQDLTKQRLAGRGQVDQINRPFGYLGKGVDEGYFASACQRAVGKHGNIRIALRVQGALGDRAEHDRKPDVVLPLEKLSQLFDQSVVRDNHDSSITPTNRRWRGWRDSRSSRE